MLSIDEILERLEKRYEVDELVEILEVPVEVFLQRFDDYVEQKYDTLCEELEDV